MVDEGVCWEPEVRVALDFWGYLNLEKYLCWGVPLSFSGNVLRSLLVYQSAQGQNISSMAEFHLYLVCRKCFLACS